MSGNTHGKHFRETSKLAGGNGSKPYSVGFQTCFHEVQRQPCSQYDLLDSYLAQ